MRKMKIVRCKRSTYWYSKDMGKVFEVEDEVLFSPAGNKGMYKVVTMAHHYLDVDDCIELEYQLELDL